MTAPQQPPGWPGRDRPLVDSPLGDLVAGRIDEAEYRRRMQLQERRAVRLDPDPLYVPPAPVTRVRTCARCPEMLVGPTARRTGICDDCQGRGGNPVAWLGLILALVALGGIIALFMLALAAPRGAQTTDLVPPRDMSAAPGPSAELPGAPPRHWLAGGRTGAGDPDALHIGPGGAPSPTTEVGTALIVYRGTATWYCSDGRDGSPRSDCSRGYGPDDLVAAIDRKDSEFRRGDRVLVTFGDRSVVVRIVDTCSCVDARVIDLTIGAFQQLAPWGLGVLPVTLQRAPALPETDELVP